MRLFVRGAVCETRSKSELHNYLNKLKGAVESVGLEPQKTRGGGGSFASSLRSDLSYAAKYDRSRNKRFPSANEMCDAICLHLLALEENSRSPVSGMTNGIRWMYLFNDEPPTLSQRK